jgi:hypothetical protein
MKTEFYNQDGTLTSYAFACGYVQSKGDKNTYVKLYKEHNTYHLIMIRNNERVIWLSYDSNKLSQARKDYKNTNLS